MAKSEIVAAKVKALKRGGVDVGRGGVLGGDGIFYYSKRSAHAFAKQHKRKLLEINDAGVSGWLVLNEPAD